MKKSVKFIFIFVLLLVGITFMSAVSHTDFVFAETSGTPAADETTATVTCSSTTVHRGQTFTLDVTLENNQGFTGLMLLVKYDSSAMKLVSVKKGSALNNLTFDYTNIDEWETYNAKNGIQFLWSGADPDKTNGVLMTLTFDSVIDAEVGDYPVQIGFDPENTNSNYGVPAIISTINGVVTVTKGRYSVQYYNYDNTLLYEKDYNETEIPEYSGDVPTHADDDKYSYEFNGWKGIVSDEPDVIKYVAEYNSTPRSYIVRFYVDGELYKATDCAYNSTIDLSDKPKKANYTFFGWFTDEECQQKLRSDKMPPNELVLYGYQKYNIREENIPEMVLSVYKWEDNLVTVDATLTVNTGIASMRLTLEYDRQYLTFKGFQRGEAFDGGMSYTNGAKIQLGDDGYYRETQDGALSAQPFVFGLENNGGNSTACALVLRLQFELSKDAPDAVYNITFSYDHTKDISYFNDANELWYTKVDIVGATIPKGEKNHWNEPVDGSGNVVVDVTSNNGLPVQTELQVKDVTSVVSFPADQLNNMLGTDKKVSNIYRVTLSANGEVVQPTDTFTVKIKLTDAQLKSDSIYLYTVNESGGMTLSQANVVGDYLVFSTDNLGDFAVVESVENAPTEGGSESGLMTVVIVLIVVIVILMLLLIVFLIMRRRNDDEEE